MQSSELLFFLALVVKDSDISITSSLFWAKLALFFPLRFPRYTAHAGFMSQTISINLGIFFLSHYLKKCLKHFKIAAE